MLHINKTKKFKTIVNLDPPLPLTTALSLDGLHFPSLGLLQTVAARLRTYRNPILDALEGAQLYGCWGAMGVLNPGFR